MPEEHPWYDVVEGSTLEQGDILLACPVIVPVPDMPFPVPEGDVPGDLLFFDVVVMTQSCDLEHENLDDVTICPHSDVSQAGRGGAPMGMNRQKEIRNGYRPRYSLLEACDTPEVRMGIRVVDFGRIFSLPNHYVQRHAENQGPRLRLRPPYREHLSQAFARFFMRVGLPQNIKLP
jgi:hypothetical protein